jgi:hypothetical protein
MNEQTSPLSNQMLCSLIDYLNEEFFLGGRKIKLTTIFKKILFLCGTKTKTIPIHFHKWKS